jgi:hypothetical protein
LGKTIPPLADSKVNPSIMVPTGKIVFLNEFLRFVSNFNTDVFQVWNRCVDVEVLEVDRAEAHSFLVQDTVEKELNKFERSCVGANVVAWVADAVATNSGAGAIRIIFLQRNFTNHHGVADFLLFV